MPLAIELRERGQPELIGRDDCVKYDLEALIRPLADARVIGLRVGATGMLVNPGVHVGELRAPGVVLRVLPKSPGLLAAMERMALAAPARLARHLDAAGTGTAGPDSDPAGAFARALSQAIQTGLPFRYGRRTKVTSYPRGRILLGQTVRQLASRGVSHRVVAALPVTTGDPRLARIVRAALECLPEMPDANAGSIAEASALAEAFEPVPPYATAAEALLDAEAAAIEADGLRYPEATRLAVLCRELLARSYEASHEVIAVPGGTARFRNLERLWERCVARMVACQAPRGAGAVEAAFHGLAGRGVRLFDDGGPALDPDVVLTHGNRTIAVVDAKYKRRDEDDSDAAPDLYQLDAYVRRTGAAVGMLVAFTEGEPRAELVGTTAQGASVLSVALSPDIVLSQGENALDAVLRRAPAARERFQKCFADSLGE